MPLPAAEEDSKPEPVPFPVAVNIRSVTLTGLFLLAVLYTLYFARVLILPLVLVFLLDALLSPLVRRLKRAGVPEAVSAALILVSLVGTVGLGVYRLSGPAAAWVARAPQSLVKGRVIPGRERTTPPAPATWSKPPVSARPPG